eukprot:scaffold1903_cov396-Prasinococcus_capsulatus_cf.AAC.3
MDSLDTPLSINLNAPTVSAVIEPTLHISSIIASSRMCGRRITVHNFPYIPLTPIVPAVCAT